MGLQKGMAIFVLQMAAKKLLALLTNLFVAIISKHFSKLLAQAVLLKLKVPFLHFSYHFGSCSRRCFAAVVLLGRAISLRHVPQEVTFLHWHYQNFKFCLLSYCSHGSGRQVQGFLIPASAFKGFTTKSTGY